MHKSRSFLLLVLMFLAVTAGCRRESPAPKRAAKPTAHIAATRAAVDVASVPQLPVVLHRPAIEALPTPIATPKRKIAESLRQAKLALDAGRLDERNVSKDQANSAAEEVSAPSAAGNDALALYRGVLATDPENKMALQGIAAIVEALRIRAQGALDREDVVDAQRDVGRLALLSKDDAGLPALQAALDKGWRVAGLIERGQRLESAGALIAPRASNAAAAYRQALALAPSSVAAHAGLSRIEGGFIARALAEADAAHYPRAERWIAQAANVQGDSPALRDARASLLVTRQRHALLLKSQADVALDAVDTTRAEQLLGEIERTLPGTPLEGQLRQRIANVRLYGKFLPGQVFADPFSSSGRAPPMVTLPVGSFRMGSPDDEPGRDPNEGPQRRIEFRHGFAMARTDVTVEQFGRFVQATRYRTDAERSGSSMVYDEARGKLESLAGVTWRDDHVGQTASPQQPVLHVSWNDAQAYAIWLSSQTAQLYRLPSEAEFEYALRAGGTGIYPWPGNSPPKGVGNLAGSDPSPSGRHWGDAFVGYSDGYWGPSPVAKFSPNAFGLYDMVGDVAQWTQDCWHDGYRRAPENASAWVNPGCTKRVVRGASWASSPTQARSAYRASLEAESSNARVGFRVVREL